MPCGGVWRRWQMALALGALGVLCELVSGCALVGSTSPVLQPTAGLRQAVVKPGSAIPAIPAIHTVEREILDNMQANGFDADVTLNKGLGGLWVNWRYGTRPLQTNVNGTGEPDDPGASPRHDPLTDVRYLHNLWSYTRQNPTDTRYERELARYTRIVTYEFANSRNERGWLYDEFMALYALSHDPSYRAIAYHLADSYARAYDARIGGIYHVSPLHPYGSYRVDFVLEAGCALMQAGVTFRKAQWLQDGRRVVQFVLRQAYIPRYHTFASQLDHVLSPDGSANPHPTFFFGNLKNYAVFGGKVQMGGISQIVISLLHASLATNDRDLLQQATDVLTSYAFPATTLQMWDQVHGGYFFAATFSGTSPAQPGTVAIETRRKEAGRQIIMLQAFHLANLLTRQKYAKMEQALLWLALNRVYYAPGHGVLYEVKPDWTPLAAPNGLLADMVTTEAMGAELESLFALSQ